MKTSAHASTSLDTPAAATGPRPLARGRHAAQARAVPAVPAVRAGIPGPAQTAARLQAAATAQEQARMVLDSAVTEALNYWAEDRLARLGIPWPEED